MVHDLKPAGDLQPLTGRRQISKPRVVVLLLVLGLLGSGLWWLANVNNPKTLGDTYLSGERGPGCARVIIASDESGSMLEFVQPREMALAQLLNWAPGNLRADDELAVLTVSGNTFVSMPPTAVGDRPALGDNPGPTDGTSLGALLGVIRGLPATPCVQSLVLLSDGIFHDLPKNSDDARAQMRDSGISELFLLVPGEQMEVEPAWAGLYPYAAPVVFDGTNPDETGLTFGRTLAKITKQELKTR